MVVGGGDLSGAFALGTGVILSFRKPLNLLGVIFLSDFMKACWYPFINAPAIRRLVVFRQTERTEDNARLAQWSNLDAPW